MHYIVVSNGHGFTQPNRDIITVCDKRHKDVVDPVPMYVSYVTFDERMAWQRERLGCWEWVLFLDNFCSLLKFMAIIFGLMIFGL